MAFLWSLVGIFFLHSHCGEKEKEELGTEGGARGRLGTAGMWRWELSCPFMRL